MVGFIGDHCETGKTLKTHFNVDNSFRIVQARVSDWLRIFLSSTFFSKKFQLKEDNNYDQIGARLREDKHLVNRWA